ncbi:Uncharacterized protein TPAR_06888 [Tolypocladium paradoxum]|uniref:C2H2-type domain-containing protein n=1 Tax=Tolypocladium paradoxum TaxID=94208 RepID=A0A2S4KRW5_9HYPO|nr:Uncharacterized protein TPAR_06888 [Tolypocladium paradoxum]
MSTPNGAYRDIRGFFPVQPTPTTTPKKRTWPTGSSDDEDPLSRSAESARPRAPGSQTGRPNERAAEPTFPATKSRIAVVLAASPSKKPLSVMSDDKHRVGAAKPVVSDLSPHYKRQVTVRETPVPLPKIPNWSAPSASTSAPPSTQHRGRPKGWKPGMSYSIMRGHGPPSARVRQVRAKAPPPGFAKPRRRPPKPPSPPPGEVYNGLKPQFVEFLCEWTGCRAELHNLDTLRRHVYAVHDRDDKRICRWGKCSSTEPAREFSDTEQFTSHVEEAHLVPFAWHVGDGPRNDVDSGSRGGNGPEDEIPGFLKDAEGNQVTPSIRDQEVEDLATWRVNRRRLKELLIRRNENLPDDELDDP